MFWKIYFTLKFALQDVTFNRPNEVQESDKVGIHLSLGRARQRYGSIPSMKLATNLHLPKFFQNYNAK